MTMAPMYGFLLAHSGSEGVQVEADNLAEAIRIAERDSGKTVITGRQLDAEFHPPAVPIASLWGGHR